MASKSESRKKSGRARSGVAGDTGRIIAELKYRVAVLEKELQLKHDSTSPDAAERNLAEDARSRLAAIITSSDNAIIGKTLNGIITSWNKGAERIYGYTEAEAVGKSIGIIVPPDRMQELEEFLDKVRRGEHMERYEAVSVTKDGRRIVVSVTISPILDASGNVIGALTIARDITECKNAEDTLRASRARLESVFLAVPAGIGSTVNRVTKEANDKLCEMLGYSREELIGKNAHMVYPSDEEFERAGREGYGQISMTGTGTVETKWRRKDGRILDILMSTMQIEPGNVAAGVMFAALDITERKQAEEALKASRMQADLYVDLMCHDISNMNQVGMGFLEMALDMLDLDEMGREMLLKPKSAFENSSRLIDNVRKLQKARAGEYQFWEMDVGEVLGKVHDYYSKQHGPNVTINYTMNAGYLVNANELLYDLFSNLVGNAIKHSKTHPIIDSNVEPISENGRDYYKVTIDDQGPGIPDELKAVIFDRKMTGNIKSKGSGIGLLMVKILVECYNGRVWVEDRVKGDHTKGARFVVMLPVAE